MLKSGWTKLRAMWDRVRHSFWFLPSCMAILAVVLALATVALDEAIDSERLDSVWWAYTGSAEGAAAVLGRIAGSMVTIAGVVFSMTLVVLTLASSQFGPRILRTFMRDTTNQVVIGTFVATFLYCLMVLRTVRRNDPSTFVPHVSVTVGLLFALISVGVLIHFVHHVAVSIQADEVIARIWADLSSGIDRLFPEHLSETEATSGVTPAAPLFPEDSSVIVPAPDDGYLQFLDEDHLIQIAQRNDLLLMVERKPGAYIVRGAAFARIIPGNKATEELIHEVQRTMVLGAQRTPAQDLEFSILQLVEIAVRALSPGINDPFTAVTCVDRLTSALARLATRRIPPSICHDSESRVRLIRVPFSYAELVALAYDAIAYHGRSEATVTQRLLNSLGALAPFLCRPGDRELLLDYVRTISCGARDQVQSPEERSAIDKAANHARQCLAG